jgi:hypothetical protein
MPNLRELLNEIKWTKQLALVEIWYVHRGAPKDTMIITGSDIVAIERSFLQTSTASIPFHRIFKIVYDGKVIFER